MLVIFSWFCRRGCRQAAWALSRRGFSPVSGKMAVPVAAMVEGGCWIQCCSAWSLEGWGASHMRFITWGFSWVLLDFPWAYSAMSCNHDGSSGTSPWWSNHCKGSLTASFAGISYSKLEKLSPFVREDVSWTNYWANVVEIPRINSRWWSYPHWRRKFSCLIREEMISSLNWSTCYAHLCFRSWIVWFARLAQLDHWSWITEGCQLWCWNLVVFCRWDSE